MDGGDGRVSGYPPVSVYLCAGGAVCVHGKGMGAEPPAHAQRQEDNIWFPAV